MGALKQKHHYCYRGGSRTASSAPPEGTIIWILVSCHSDYSSHFPSYLGLINHPHLFPIYTHTYKPHTHTDLLQSLDLPCCHFWALYPCLLSCYLTLDCLLIILVVWCLPRLGLCLLDCDCLPPTLTSHLVFNSVSPLLFCLAGVWPCTVWLFSIKLQMDPNFWLFVTEDFAKQSSSSAHATINRAICTSFTTPLAPTPVKSNHHPDRGAGQSTARAKCIITRNCISSSTSPQ